MTTLKTERINFLTHAITFVVWVPLGIFLVWISRSRPDLVAANGLYSLASGMLFLASANYHRLKSRENEDSLHRRLDHMAIFVMIAGTYTPTVWIWFEDPWRWLTLGFQWTVTLGGMIYKLKAKKTNRIIDAALYLAMGWVVVWALPTLWQRMPPTVFLDMALGGVAYTVGALVYALKKPDPWPGALGFHEIFHLFIIAGAGFHWALVLRSTLAALAI